MLQHNAKQTVITAFVAMSMLGPLKAQSLLTQVASIPIPNVDGRMDHLAFDRARQRVFVAALEHDTVEVIDTARNAHVTSVTGFHEPQGLAVVPDLNGVAVASGASGTLRLLGADTLQTRWQMRVGGDADNVRYVGAAKRLMVAAQGGLAIVEPALGQVIQRISIAGHPESFQVEAQGTRVFANLPGASEIVAADVRSGAIVGRWPTGACQANYPMALDEAARRLFIGCRRPAAVTSFDTTTGKPVASVAVVGDTDDLFYDNARQRIYVIGGEGFIDILQRSGDTIQRVGRVTTRAGTRTGLWVAEQGRLYVAVPARDRQPAEVRVFEAAPLR